MVDGHGGTIITVNNTELKKEVKRSIKTIKESLKNLKQQLGACEHFKLDLDPDVINSLILIETNILKIQKREVSKNETFIVTGDYGDLTVLKETGKIIDYNPACETERNYSDILKINIESIIKLYGKIYPTIDIIKVGYWLKNGDYESQV